MKYDCNINARQEYGIYFRISEGIYLKRFCVLLGSRENTIRKTFPL
jgi:hypothetical protein